MISLLRQIEGGLASVRVLFGFGLAASLGVTLLAGAIDGGREAVQAAFDEGSALAARAMAGSRDSFRIRACVPTQASRRTPRASRSTVTATSAALIS
jgi:hypothetical protein